MGCEHRRNKNVLSCRDLAIGDIIPKGAIGCISGGVACQSSVGFEVELWNTFGKTITYVWSVKLGEGGTGTTSVTIDGTDDTRSIEVWVHSATNIPIEVTCTVSDGTHTDTMMVEYISENE